MNESLLFKHHCGLTNETNPPLLLMWLLLNVMRQFEASQESFAAMRIT